MIDPEDLKKLQEEIEKYQESISSDEDNIDITKMISEYGYDIDLEKLNEELTNNIMKYPLGYKKLNSDAVEPKYNYVTDSGFDLYSVEDVEVGPFGRALIPTGLSFDINKGHEIQVRSKSGLALNQGLFVLNSPGTVDAGYTGEVKVIIFNTNNQPVTIKKGMKVAQAVVCPIITPEWLDIYETKNIKTKDRNSNGFGSTGIQL